MVKINGYSVKEIMSFLGCTKQFVSSVASRFSWQYQVVGSSKIYNQDDVDGYIKNRLAKRISRVAKSQDDIALLYRVCPDCGRVAVDIDSITVCIRGHVTEKIA